jgi:hypothetical protein
LHSPAGLPLQHLDLRSCTRLSDAALVALVQHCGGLKRLYLDGCTRLTTAGVLQASSWPGTCVLSIIDESCGVAQIPQRAQRWAALRRLNTPPPPALYV